MFPDGDFVEYLSGQAQSDVAALHQFRLLYVDGDEALHLFFEGDEDGPYYLTEVRRRAKGRAIRVYVCGGKANVLSVRTAVDADGYDTELCMFFVDRDFDTFLGCQASIDEKTYLTDDYSIENSLVTGLALEIVLCELMNMSQVDPEYKIAAANFVGALSSFAGVCRPIMAWCLAARSAGLKPNLKNVKLGQVFVVGETACVSLRPGGFKKFCVAALRKTDNVNFGQILFWRRQLRVEDQKKWLRGKLELWFFESFLLVCAEGIVSRRKAAGLRPPRIPSALRERSLFDILGPRIEKPASLTEFLDGRLGPA